MAIDWEHASAATPPTFVPAELPAPYQDAFHGLTLPISSVLAPSDIDATLAHELGHALFSLADKYVYDQVGYDGRPNWTSYPACARDLIDAEARWGDRIGDIDPFFDTYLTERQAAGQDTDPATVTELRDLIIVDYVETGCFGPETAIRTSRGGLMYNEYALPVLDAVSADWATAVLAAWSGDQ